MGDSLPTFLGGDGRDDDQAAHSVYQANLANSNALNSYYNNAGNNLTLANSLAGRNYYGNAAQVYGQQQNAASMLQAQANGTAPSAAQIQMGLGLGQANQQAQSAALSQQGGVLSGNTQRNMLNAEAMNSQNVLGQTAALRAQEQVSGQQQYANLLGQMQNQQQQQGQLQYNQGQNLLNYNTDVSNQQFANQLGVAQNQYNNTMGNIDHQTAAAQVAGQTAGKVISGLGQAAANSFQSS